MIPDTKYYECHVTIDPIPEHETTRREEFERLCGGVGFKPAKLIKVTGVANDKDAFCTGHARDYSDIFSKMWRLVTELRLSEFNVRRYKIEAVIFDSRSGDTL